MVTGKISAAGRRRAGAPPARKRRALAAVLDEATRIHFRLGALSATLHPGGTSSSGRRALLRNLVELGPRMQGVISRRKFERAPQVGDVHEFTLRGQEESLWALSLREERSLASWEEMEAALRRLLAGCQVVAMEVSERDAVPFVDLVPAGVVELIEDLGVQIVSSASLISGTYAQWGDRGYQTHALAGARLGAIAESAFQRALQAAQQGLGMSE